MATIRAEGAFSRLVHTLVAIPFRRQSLSAVDGVAFPNPSFPTSYFFWRRT